MQEIVERFQNRLQNQFQDKEDEMLKFCSCLYLVNNLNYYHCEDENYSIYQKVFEAEGFEEVNHKVKRRLVRMAWFIVGQILLSLKREKTHRTYDKS